VRITYIRKGEVTRGQPQASRGTGHAAASHSIGCVVMLAVAVLRRVVTPKFQNT
jgi:hypothetical protein